MPEHQFTISPSVACYNKGCRCAECKALASAYRRDYYLRHEDKMRAHGRKGVEKYRTLHPERVLASQERYNKSEKAKEKSRRYRERHPDRQRIATTKWRNAHAEQVRATKRNWARNNPDKAAEYRARHGKATQDRYRQTEKGRRTRHKAWLAYHARKKGAQGNTTLAQLEARWAFYGHRCYLCGAPATTTDHVIPLSRGGSHWPSNLRPACKSCNSRKYNLTLADYLRAR